MDSGCEGACIRLDECKRLGIPIIPLDHTDKLVPTQADGNSPLDILGKVKFHPKRDKITLEFEGYVARNLQSPILCGAPFLVRNKIVQELHNRRIVIDGKYYIEETSEFCPNPVPEVSISSLSLSQASYSIELAYTNKALYKRGYTISGNCMEEKHNGGLCNPFLTFFNEFLL